MRVDVALSRRTVGAWAMWTFGASASAPMVVLAGGITATYTSTGVVGVPAAFVVVAAVVGFLAVGYVSMARYIPHAAVFYAVLSRGLTREIGVAGGTIALLAYNSIQVSLYGLFGATVQGLAGHEWWVWAVAAIVIVGCVGVRGAPLSARVIGTVLVASILFIVLFDIAALRHPASGVLELDGLHVENLFVDGIGGVLALTIAAFMGIDVIPAYAEEARSDRSATRAVYAAVAFLGAFYCLAALATGVAVGWPDIGRTSTMEETVPYGLLNRSFGALIAESATAILLGGMLTSMLAFHNTAARYAFAMAREGVLPAALATAGRVGRGSPVGGSLLQTGVAAAVVLVFALTADNPMTLFRWLSTLGAVALLTLLLASAVASLRFFGRSGRTRSETPWVRWIAPTLGLALGLFVYATTLLNLGSLLGLPPGSRLELVVPGIVTVAVLCGLVWGRYLRSFRSDTYNGIGEHTPDPLAMPEPRLAHLDV